MTDVRFSRWNKTNPACHYAFPHEWTRWYGDWTRHDFTGTLERKCLVCDCWEKASLPLTHDHWRCVDCDWPMTENWHRKALRYHGKIWCLECMGTDLVWVDLNSPPPVPEGFDHHEKMLRAQEIERACHGEWKPDEAPWDYGKRWHRFVEQALTEMETS